MCWIFVFLGLQCFLTVTSVRAEHVSTVECFFFRGFSQSQAFQFGRLILVPVCRRAFLKGCLHTLLIWSDLETHCACFFIIFFNEKQCLVSLYSATAACQINWLPLTGNVDGGILGSVSFCPSVDCYWLLAFVAVYILCYGSDLLSEGRGNQLLRCDRPVAGRRG